jgi:hypothetical protein
MYPMEGVTMVRTCLIVISEGDTPMICEVSTAKITGFKSLNKNHPGNLKISQVFEIIQKILNWLIFSLLGPGAYRNCSTSRFVLPMETANFEIFFQKLAFLGALGRTF